MIIYPSDGSAGRGSTNQLGVAVASDDHDTLPHPNNSQGSPLERGPGQFVFAGGSRPLSGYTIKRGVGAGGFGEIYYAVSDAGKEVALKLIQRHRDVELRGIRQCLNLKHPNLLSLYDVRQDDQGNSWVVMEYVSGRNLQEVLADHPEGMPTDQALAWIHGIGAGVAYLHDRGIVHRDLKPANIFCDEGVMKVGDYGLSKFISCSRRSGQTESVGTVHYMAPEVANGRYGKEIDIYALGIMFYEMLTGRVPFDGESVGEVLMKHLTAQPDLSMLAEPYRTIVGRALEKDPARRFNSVSEMLTCLPRPGGESLAGPVPPAVAVSPDIVTAEVVHEPWAQEVARHIFRPVRSGLSSLSGEQLLAQRAARPRAVKLKELVESLLVGALTSMSAGAVLLVVSQAWWSMNPRWEQCVWVLVVSLVTTWSVLLAARLWELGHAIPGPRRFSVIAVGAAVGLMAWGAAELLLVRWPAAVASRGLLKPLWFTDGFCTAEGEPLAGAYVVCFVVMFLLVRWWRQADPRRLKRLSITTLFGCAILAWIVAGLGRFPQPWLTLVAVSSSIGVQLASPWLRSAFRRRP